MTQPMRMLSDRYEVRGIIGRGGMADVHAGFDKRLGREVAIKILRSELARDPSFLHRFRREAQSAASLNHPSIVAVFDSGEEPIRDLHGADAVQPFIVMEYVHGTTLRERLSEEGVLPPSEACSIMAQVLHALEYSHRHGIVHRDVKPGNVMVTPTGVAKVMDFGIARAIADSAATMTNTSVVIGTAQYLSPEQAQGHEIDARSDIYSAGCLMYELVTGRTPFVGESPVSIAYQHVGEPPQPPSVYNENLDPCLDTVILHALEKDPENRYQSAVAFAEDLEAIQRGERTQAEAAAGALGAGALVSDDTEMHSPVVARSTEETEPDPENKRRPWLIPLLVFLAALLGALGLLAANGAFSGTERVPVPSVVNQQDEVAQQALTQAGLSPQRSTATNAAPVGTVVAQSPQPGTEVELGSAVSYTVSSGPGTVEVPALRNFDQSTATSLLTNSGLQVAGVNAVDSKEVSAGNVISTDPKAGEKVQVGTAVTLNISTGRVTVPDVRGLSRNAAMEKLKDAGLGRKFTPVPGNEKPGTVTSQSYQPGEKIPVGTEVELTVVAEPVPTETRTQTETVTLEPTTPATPPPAEPTGDTGVGDGDAAGEEPAPTSTGDDEPAPEATSQADPEPTAPQ